MSKVVNNLNFLSNIQVLETEDKPSRSGGGVRKEWNPPAGLTIRVWKDGKVFPSQELVDKFGLEYPDQYPLEELENAEKQEITLKSIELGNGFDVADTDEFKTFQTGGTRLLVISPCKREEGKVDLFASVTYDKTTGKPKSSVMRQGAATFGNDFLIPKIEEIYGITFYRPAVEAKEAKLDEAGKEISPAVTASPEQEGVDFVDLVFLGQQGENSSPFLAPKGFAFFPKRFARGESKGEMTIERREHPQMYVLYPKSLMEGATEETQEAATEETPSQEQAEKA